MLSNADELAELIGWLKELGQTSPDAQKAWTAVLKSLKSNRRLVQLNPGTDRPLCSAVDARDLDRTERTRTESTCEQGERREQFFAQVLAAPARQSQAITIVDRYLFKGITLWQQDETKTSCRGCSRASTSCPTRQRRT